MTAEKIIERIKKDSEKEIKNIKKEAEKKANEIIENAKQQAKDETKKILAEGKKQTENLKKILVSQANQDAKRKIMRVREELIEKCFTKIYPKLSTLNQKEYERMVRKLVEDGCKKLGSKCKLLVSRDIDKEIAEDLGIPVEGNVESLGGIILKSSDGKVTIDLTFNGILKRNKDEIRIKVAKLLFS
ncbi:MAG: V-type ATP synthase subunit E [Elusimicrobiota bacterium]